MLKRKEMFKKKIFRKKIQFNDLVSVRPISSVFGFDRGMPIDRYYIEKFLESNKNCIKGKVLEVADSFYSNKFGSSDMVPEILHFDKTNINSGISGDLTKKETIPAGAFDCFICTQTFNFIYDAKEAFRGAYHLLKKDGIMLCTVAGISQISRFDMDKWGDFWRFTDKSIQYLSEEAGFIETKISVFGNVAASIAFLQGISVEDLPDISILDKSDNDYQLIIGVVAFK
jgi:hypothetical protein